MACTSPFGLTEPMMAMDCRMGTSASEASSAQISLLEDIGKLLEIKRYFSRIPGCPGAMVDQPRHSRAVHPREIAFLDYTSPELGIATDIVLNSIHGVLEIDLHLEMRVKKTLQASSFWQHLSDPPVHRTFTSLSSKD